MVDNEDINMMAMLCLSQLSENEESHNCIFETVNPTLSNIGDETPARRRKSAIKQNEQQSIFSRLNYLIEKYKPIDHKGHLDA